MTMITFTAYSKVPDKANAQALGEALEALETAPTGVGVFEIEDGSQTWEVGGYFLERPDGVQLDLLAAVHGATGFVISEVPDTDWVAHVRRELSPVEAGRFFVYGAHDADKVPEACVPLLIEAAMAFGTGHHGTTQGCLSAFDALLAKGVVPARVADIGCGTAVLAMAAAKVLTGQVIASDIDEVAVEVAVANVDANDLAGRVQCLEATGFDHPEIAAAAPFDLVFANILKGPLVELAPTMAQHTAPGGHIILSGILVEQGDEVVQTYTQNGYNLVDRQDIVEWTTLTLQKS